MNQSLKIHSRNLTLMYHNISELKELIASTLSIEQIMDILDFDVYDLIDALEAEIEERGEEFEDAIKDL